VAETTTTSKVPDETAQLPNAVDGMELRMVNIKDIIIPEGRHKRRGRRRQSLLGESMEDLGLDTPVSLSPAADGKYVLVAGGGRLAEAQAKGWTQVHGLIKVRDELTRAASTAAENIAREDLSPAEEADAMEILIKAGDTPENAARKVGLTPQERTQRMALVELPEPIRAVFHWDGLSVKVATLVKTLYDGNHDIGLEIGKLAAVIPGRVNRALEQGAGSFFRELAWLHRDAKLRGKPPFIATFHRGSDSGRSMGWNPEDRDRIKLKGAAGKWFTEASNSVKWSHDRPRIVLSEEDLDQAVAIRVAYHSPGEHGFVWIHDRGWLTGHINEFVLPRMKKDAETARKESPLAKLKKAVKGKVDLAKMTAGELAPSLERKFKRELQPKAYAANVAFGEAVTLKLAVNKLTREQALFFAYETLGADTTKDKYARSRDRGARRIAECAARVMGDWITVEHKQLKSGKTKTTVTYLEGEAAETRMWEYIKAADTPEAILQRAIHMYAAAAFFKRECGANGKEPRNQNPSNDTAARALAKIVKPFIPIAVKRLEREIDDFNATRQAETMIAEAKAATDGKQPTQAKERKASTNGHGKTRATSSHVLAHVQKTPGVTIPELAAKFGVRQNYLYKLLPGLEAEGKVSKQGRGWHPVKDGEVQLVKAA
jgi:ParB/RepB/Spo0J family partition protein